MSNDRIKLNVGGTIFETYQSTLTTGSAYFQALLGGRYVIPKTDLEISSLDEPEPKQSNLIFIDRDPEAFRAVLNYLRDPQGYIPWKYKNELDYYGIICQSSVEDPLVDLHEVSNKQNGLNETSGTIQSNAEMGSLIQLVATGARNMPSKHIPSMYYGNYVNNCRFKKFPIKSSIQTLCYRNPSQIADGLKFQIPNSFDLLVSIKLMIKFNINPDHDVIINYEKIRYELFESIALYFGNTVISRIDSRLLEALESIYLTNSQKSFNLGLDRKGEIIINLPFWISPYMPLPLMINHLCSCDLKIINPQIPEGSEILMELNGVYLDTPERRKLARECGKLRIQNWFKQQHPIAVGLNSIEVELAHHSESNLPCDRMIFMVEKVHPEGKVNFDYLPVGNIHLVTNGHGYCQTNGNLLIAKLADQNLFPNKNIYVLDFGSSFGENFALDRIDSLRMRIHLTEAVTDQCLLTVYLHCDCNVQLGMGYVLTHCHDPQDYPNPNQIEENSGYTFEELFFDQPPELNPDPILEVEAVGELDAVDNALNAMVETVAINIPSI